MVVPFVLALHADEIPVQVEQRHAQYLDDMSGQPGMILEVLFWVFDVTEAPILRALRPGRMLAIVENGHTTRRPSLIVVVIHDHGSLLTGAA